MMTRGRKDLVWEARGTETCGSRGFETETPELGKCEEADEDRSG